MDNVWRTTMLNRQNMGRSKNMFHLMKQFQKKVDLELEQFDLIFHDKRLDDDRTVKDYGLQSGSTIYLVLRLKGGGGPLTVRSVSTDEHMDFFSVKSDSQARSTKQTHMLLDVSARM